MSAARKLRAEGLVIERVAGARREGILGIYWARTVNVYATIDGARFEFARFAGGAWEVYDHPKAWAGSPRFVGYMSPEHGAKLLALVERHVRQA